MGVALVRATPRAPETAAGLAVEPPIEALALFDHEPHRALDIGRGLFDAVIHVSLLERLPAAPNPRDAAILRVQRAQVHGDPVERNAGGRDPVAELLEQRAVVVEEAAFAEQPGDQLLATRRRGLRHRYRHGAARRQRGRGADAGTAKRNMAKPSAGIGAALMSGVDGDPAISGGTGRRRAVSRPEGCAVSL